MIKKILMGFIILFIGIQFVPVDRSNPTGLEDPYVFSDRAIQKIVEKACFDCHSNETKWPWYSYIAPVSWSIEEHVRHGRKEVNFSIFEKYSLKRKIKKFDEIVDEIEEDEMPLSDYLILHSEAELSVTEREKLLTWARAEKERYILEKDSLGKVK